LFLLQTDQISIQFFQLTKKKGKTSIDESYFRFKYVSASCILAFVDHNLIKNGKAFVINKKKQFFLIDYELQAQKNFVDLKKREKITRKTRRIFGHKSRKSSKCLQNVQC